MASILGAVLAFGAGSAGALSFHGIAFAKTCEDPTDVGAPLQCAFQISNFDFSNNAETVFSLSDVVSAQQGLVPSGQLLSSLELFVSPTSGAGKPTCTGPSISGDGVATPYTGATACSLPKLGSSITTSEFTHYNVQEGDYNLPNHKLTDQGSLGWRDSCSPDPSGCNTSNQTATAPGSTTVTPHPAIDIVKSTNGEDADSAPGPFILVGGAVHWTYLVTNTGDVTLSGVGVLDDHGVTVTCPKTTLAVNEQMTCTADGTATAGQYTNIGTANGHFEDLPVQDTNPSNYFGAAPGLAIVKKTNDLNSTCPTGAQLAVGSPVTWTYEVTNNGNVTLTNIHVVDDNGTPGNIADDVEVAGSPIASLAPGASTTLTRNGTAQAGQYTNIATATSVFTATGGATQNVSDDDSDCYFGSNPGIHIEKATNGQDADNPTGPIVAVGSTVTWTYVVTNTGNVPLHNVTVGDDAGTVGFPGDDFAPTFTGGDTNNDGLLDLTETWTYTATGIATAGQYANLATTTGSPPTGPPVTDDDASHYFGAAPSLTIVKRTNNTNNTCPIVANGSTVTWTYEVTNTGNVTLTNVHVVDDNGTPGNTADDVEVPGSPIASLAPGASTTLTRTGTANPGSYTNVATASTTFTAGALNIPVSANESDCYFGSNPGIHIEKATNGQDADSAPGPIVTVGSTITWTYVVTNTGNVPLHDITVADDQAGVTPTYQSGDTNANGVLDLTETWTYSATGTAVAGQYANIGTTTGKSPINEPVSDTDPSHYFAPNPSLTIVKKTNATNNQCPTGPTVPVGSTVTWSYVITNTGNVTLTDIEVTDNNGTAGTTADDFHPSGSPIASLAPGASTTLTATGTAAAGQYTNIATAATTFTQGSVTIPLSVNDNDCYFGSNATIHIEKATNAANPSNPTAAEDADAAPGPIIPTGGAVTWTYLVTNPGNVPLSGIVVTDDNGTPGNTADDFHPSFTSGDANSNSLLDPGETWLYTSAGHTAVAGQYENIATAAGTHNGNTVTDTDPSHYYGGEDAVTTDILNSSNAVVTSGVGGTVVHDKAYVAKAAGTPASVPNPTGSVTFHRFTNASCSGASANDQTVALTPGSPSTAVSSNFTTVGSMSYRADYSGDANYPARSGACEPFTIILSACTLGYPDSSHPLRSQATFNESTVLAAFSANASAGTVSAWYTDEHALTLGVDPDPDGTPVTPMSGSAAQHAANPDIGDVTAADGAGRPLYPAAFVTDITFNTTLRTGDWQQNDNNNGAQGPQDLFGTWKDAIKSGSTITPGADPAANSTFGPGADTPPTIAKYEGYRTEVRWNISSLKDENGNPVQVGHSYRIVFMVHDGDQNNSGGDVGEACVNLTVPQPPPPAAPAITSGNSTTFTEGTAGSFNVTATGSPAPTFSKTGALPSGVTLAADGTLAGTPASGTFGSYPITITASNGVNPDATQSFTLTVNPPPIQGLKFNWISGGTNQGCTGPSGTTTRTVVCSIKNLGAGTMQGTVSFFNGATLPGIPAPNNTGSTINITPVVSGGGGTASTANIPNGSASSQTLSITQTSTPTWTYSYATGGITYRVQIKFS